MCYNGNYGYKIYLIYVYGDVENVRLSKNVYDII